jgi:hypothetical protein
VGATCACAAVPDQASAVIASRVAARHLKKVLIFSFIRRLDFKQPHDGA